MANALVETIAADKRSLRNVYIGLEKSPHDGKSLTKWVDPRRISPLITRAIGDEYAADEDMIASACSILEAFTSNHLLLGSDREGIMTLLEMCARIAKDPQLMEKTVFSVGFGGSEDPPSLRAPAYILSIVHTVSSLMDLGLRPQIRVFCGQNAAILANGMEERKVWPNTLLLFFLIRSFLETFFPKIAPLVSYDIDRPYINGVMSCMQALTKRLSQDPPKHVAQALRIAKEWGFNHGGEDGRRNATLYGAAHPVMFGVVAPRDHYVSSWLERSAGNIAWVIANGGPPELQFMMIERYLLNCVPGLNKEFGTEICTVPFTPLISPIGSLPVYYRPALAKDVQADIRQIRQLLNAPDLGDAWKSATSGFRVHSDFVALFKGITRRDEDTGETLQAFLRWAADVLEPLEYVRQECGSFGLQLALAKMVIEKTNSTEAALEVEELSETERQEAWEDVCESFFGLATTG